MVFSHRRRSFCLSAVALGLGSSMDRSEAQQNPDLDYDALINGQYANRIRLRQVGGYYMDSNFRLSSSPETWTLVLGRYDGKMQGVPVHWTGYWIFNPEGTKCWQAVNYNGPLHYWNEDTKATGYPQDWELFKFEKLNPQLKTVRIKNAVNTGGYVGLVGNQFDANHPQSSAAIFYVEFDSTPPPAQFRPK